MKKVLLIGAGVVAALIVILLLLPPFIDLGAYKAQYLPLVEEALGRKVDVGEVRLRIVPAPSIRLSSLKVSDNPAFSPDPFFTAKELRLHLKLWPLLQGQFQVESFILDGPSINLLKRPDGTFNFADIAKKQQRAEKKEREPAPKTTEPLKLSELIPSEIRIENGNVILQTKGQKPLQVQGIDVSLKDFSTLRPFPYRVALALPGLKPITLEGNLQYDERAAALHLKENRLRAEDLDFTLSGTISELTGAPQLNLTLVNDGFEVKPILRLLSASGTTPKELEVSGPAGLRVELKGPSNNLQAQIQANFKGLKVYDSRAFKGSVTGGIQLSAPLGGEGSLTQKARGSGRLAASDGELTNVDLVRKIEQITGLLGMAKAERTGATTFKSLETDFALAGGIAEFKRIYLQSPAMEVQGSGKMTLESPTLDLGADAALSLEISARAGRGKAATFFKDSQGRIVVPLKLTGPVKKPSVNLDSEKLVKKGASQFLEQKQGGLFERFFRKR